MSETPPPLLWRAVATDPPTEADFLSHQAEGLPRRRNETDDLYTGVSTFDDPAIVASVAMRFGEGRFLAGLALAPGGPVRWKKTRGAGHYTVYGTPAELLARVAEVRPVVPGAKETSQ